MRDLKYKINPRCRSDGSIKLSEQTTEIDIKQKKL